MMFAKQVFHQFYQRAIGMLQAILYQREDFTRPFLAFILLLWALGFLLGLLFLGIALSIRSLLLLLTRFSTYLFFASGAVTIYNIVLSFFNWIINSFCSAFDIEEPAALFNLQTFSRIPLPVVLLFAIPLLWLNHILIGLCFSYVDLLTFYTFDSLFLAMLVYMWLPINESKEDLYENFELFVPTIAALAATLYEGLFIDPYHGESPSLTEFGFHDYEETSLFPDESFRDPIPNDPSVELWETKDTILSQYLVPEYTADILLEACGDIPVKPFIKARKRRRRLYAKYVSFVKIFKRLKREYGFIKKKKKKDRTRLRFKLVNFDFLKFTSGITRQLRGRDIFMSIGTGKPVNNQPRWMAHAWWEPFAHSDVKPHLRGYFTDRLTKRDNPFFLVHFMGRYYQAKDYIFGNVVITKRSELKHRIKELKEKK